MTIEKLPEPAPASLPLQGAMALVCAHLETQRRTINELIDAVNTLQGALGSEPALHIDYDRLGDV